MRFTCRISVVVVPLLISLSPLPALLHAQDILYFQDGNSGQDRMAMALADLPVGFTVTNATSPSDFATKIATHDFELGIFFQQNIAGSNYDDAFAALSNFVAGGGRAIAADWTRDNTHAQAFGLMFTENGDFNQTSMDVTNSTLAANLSNPIAVTDPGRPVFATDLVTTFGTSAADFANGNSAIVIANGRRSIFNGFLSESVVDVPAGVQLYTNEIIMTLTAPEPTTLVLCCLGSLATLCFRR